MATIDEILKRCEIWSSAVASGDSLEQLAKAACEGCRAAVSQLGSQLLDMGYALGNNSDWAPTFKNFEWTGYKRPETAVDDPTDFFKLPAYRDSGVCRISGTVWSSRI